MVFFLAVLHLRRRVCELSLVAMHGVSSSCSKWASHAVLQGLL